MSSQPTRALAVVAMSGGVDSSVAAGLLVEEGVYDVAGVTLRLADDPTSDGDARARTCCAPDDVRDARRVADRLGIPHYVTNDRALFDREVVAPFVRAYAEGRTPNPCTLCNEKVKFGPLLVRAQGLGAAVLATGHYARVVRGEDGRYRLLRARDEAKDQSYFLYGLGQEALSMARFPLGELTKAEVREKARALGLPTAEKAESQEICFVAGRYEDVVEAHLGPRPGGEVVHEDGRVLGRHAGVHRFTVGQRRGLGIASSEPLYVLGVDAASCRVTVGPRASLERSELWLSGLRWVHAVPDDRDLTVRVRYRHVGVPGRVADVDDGRARVRLDAPVAGAAPGQAVVLYDGDEVLGGGTLEATA